MSVLERMTRALSLGGVDNKPEDIGVLSGAARVIEALLEKASVNPFNTALPFQWPTYTFLEEIFDDCGFYIYGREVEFVFYDINTVGKKIANYFSMANSVTLQGDGLNWKQIDDENLSCGEFNLLWLRWDMLESRNDYE